MSHIYNIPYGAPFLKILAEKFSAQYQKNPLELANVLFLTQNRRSCQTLKEAFLEVKGLTPFLLPQIVPVYETDEDEVFFESGGQDAADLNAAVSPVERLFLFAKMIASKKSAYNIKDISYAQSLSLAADLGKLMDDVYAENLSFDNLKKIVPEQYAQHWQETLDFLKIVSAFWPDILKERNLTDASKRRNMLLEKKAEYWLKENPYDKIVAVGLGVPFEVLKDVLKSICALKNGEIYLYGLDRYMPDDEWENLSKTHPQFEKKEVFRVLGLNRADVQDIKTNANRCREKFVCEIMRDAETTDCWRTIGQNEDLKKGMEGVRLIEAADTFEEALAIALIMREVLETPNKTAALVTPDRELARAVSSALKRFGVEIDDTAGMPLHLSPVGIYLRQILDVLENDFSCASVAALLKNPFVHMQKNGEEFRKEVREAECEKRTPRYNQKNISEKQDVLDEKLYSAFEPLKMLYTKKEVPLSDLMRAHIALAENLAEDDKASGAQNLWRHEDGRLCAAVLAKILEKADIAGCVMPKEYSAVLFKLLSLETVRKPYGTHPRLKILGLIEARLSAFDTVIIGSLNEGMWPKANKTDPFMSGAMKTDFGLPAPEISVGVTADDLSAYMNAKEVYLTRAVRCDGVPMNKSRYWLRLETVLKALNVKISDLADGFYLNLARQIDEAQKQIEILPVMPKPPLAARPRRFSASSLKKWMQNPYDIYAEKILRLKPLNKLDEEPDMRDFGNLMHRALEKFCMDYPSTLDDKAGAVLTKLVYEELDAAEANRFKKIFWKSLADKMIKWFLENMPAYLENINHVASEAQGKMIFNGPAGEVVLEARADQIDETTDGFYQIGDYKTGSCPKSTDVVRGFEPQLPLEGLIASVGGFEKNGQKLPAKPVKHLVYFALGNEIYYPDSNKDSDLDTILEETKERIEKMIAAFDNEETPYLFNPNPKHQNAFSEYEHLARFKEWKGKGE